MKNFETKKAVGIGGFALLCLLAYIFVFGSHRPYINWSPIELAGYLASNNKSAEGCMDLIWFEIMSPSQAEQRALCVYKYAEFTKDPTACELLMPSDYGRQCVGAATTFNGPCALGRDRSVEYKGITASLNECAHGTNDPVLNSCCIVSMAAFVIEHISCDGIRDVNMLDQCNYQMAYKQREPSLCNVIQNENLHIGCEVELSALKKNPDICNGCVPAIHENEI